MGKKRRANNVSNKNKENSIEISFPKEKLSKLAKTLKYYLEENYGNLNINISPRIIPVTISLEIVNEAKRPEYRLYLIPESGLPELKIKNPASFLYFCNLHKFFPIVNEIRFKDGLNILKVSEVKDFVFLIRLFHLFFYKGYDYVLYDVVRHILKQESIKKVFEDNNLLLPLQSELFSLLKLLEDIKKATFDLPKYHLHNKLAKLNNVGTLRENIFLEIAMKYENKVREFLNFENTYLEFASFEDDTKNKVDFYLLYLLKKKVFKTTSYNKIPIQFTVSYDAKTKFNSVLHKFLKSEYSNFLYVEINGKFQNQINEVEEQYKKRLNNSDNIRNRMDSTNFPFFINTLEKVFLFPAVVAYFGIHALLSKELQTLQGLKLDSFDFSNLKIEKKNTKEKKYSKIELLIFQGNTRLCKIVLLNKVVKKK